MQKQLLAAKVEHTQVAVQCTLHLHKAGRHNGRFPRGTEVRACWAGTGNETH